MRLQKTYISFLELLKKEDIKKFMLQKFLTLELELQLMIDLKELQKNEIRSKKFREKVQKFYCCK